MPRPKQLSRAVTPLVLVVDDDPTTLVIIQKCCQHVDADSVCARSVEQAREVLHSYPVDVVVTDYWLPDGTGRDLIAFLRTSVQYMGIPAILCTADDKQAADPDLDGMGVEAIMGKPLHFDAMQGLLQQSIKKAPKRWEGASVASERLGMDSEEFTQLLKTAYVEFTNLMAQLSAWEADGESPGLEVLLVRARSAALNVGALSMARIIDLLPSENLSQDDVATLASVIGAEINPEYGPFRGLDLGQPAHAAKEGEV